MSRMCFYAMHFRDPYVASGLPILHEMFNLAPLSDFSYNAVPPIFHIFIQNGSVKKTAKLQLCI